MDADVAVTEAGVEPITLPRDQLISVHPRSSAFIRGKDSLPAALAPCVRRIGWVRGCERVHGCDVLVGVGKCARLTVREINLGWFEQRSYAGLCRRLTVRGISTGWSELHGWTELCLRLTVQGINTGWFERRGWTGRRCPLRRAIGRGAQSGRGGGKFAGWEALAGVGRDRDWRRRGGEGRLGSPRSLAVAGGGGSEAARS